MKVNLFQNSPFEFRFEELKYSQNEINLNNVNTIKKATINLEIPSISKLRKPVITKTGDFEAEKAFWKIFTTVLEEEEDHSNILTIVFTTISDETIEVRLEGRFLHRLSDLSEELLRIDLWMEIENGKTDEDSARVTLDYPDMPMSFDKENQILFVGTLSQQQKSKHKFHVEIPYTGRISISLQSGTVPVEICKLVPSTSSVKAISTGVEYDFELISENGKRFPCHRHFLSGKSRVMARMFQTDWKDSKEKVCNINLTEKGLKALLNFIYEANIDGPLGSSRITLELLETAHHSDYDIPLLEKAMKKLLLQQSSLWYTVDVALRLYRFFLKVDGCGDLKWKAMKVINSKLDDLIGATDREFENLLSEDRVAAEELMAYLKCT